MTGLGYIPGYQKSHAYDISGGDSIIVGYCTNYGPPQTNQAFRWTQATGMVGLGFLPGHTQSSANGISENGRVIVGYSGSSTSSDAFRWTASGGMQSLGRLPGGTVTMPWDVSADGSVIVGWSGSSAFMWSEAEGMRSVRDVLIEYGIDLTGWTLSVAAAVSADGRVIAGQGLHNGVSEAWRAELPRLRVVRPRSNELWLSGERDTIRWFHTTDITTVTLRYSTDGGNNFNNTIVANYPADSGKYVWLKPDTLLSRKCRIRIEKAGDPSLWGQSALFRVKGYELTRVTADSNYERYLPNPHGWRFGNHDTSSVPPYVNGEHIMWPRYWWLQFDYNTGIDPYTGRRYPGERPFFATASSDFPDWPLFVRSFGVGQCYFVTPVGLIYKPTATAYWNFLRRRWNGSCVGLASASFLAFDDKTAFRNAFPDVPDFVNVHELNLTDPLRRVINQLWVYQYGAGQKLYEALNRLVTTPTMTLRALRDMLLSETRDDRTFSIYHNTLSGGHEVNPYKIVKDLSNPTGYWVYVYDNDYPDSTNQRFFTDTVANRWSYASLPGWGGESGLFLSLPVSINLTTPILPGRYRPAMLPTAESQIGNGNINFYNSANASILVTDSQGNTMGYSDSVAFSNIPNGIPTIPKTGRFHPPIGYHLPEGEYSVRMSE
ncbi:MAG: hypothetical protein AAB393_07340, partial [Bacteroidota bacterium]